LRHSLGREILSSILGIVLAPLLLAFLSVYFAFRLLLRLVFEVFARMNVVKRRLQESPQERGQPENDSTDSHSLH